MDSVRNTRCFLFDLDGTVYLGDRLLPGAQDMMDYLDQAQIPYYYLTNNSSRSRDDYVVKLAGYGLSADRERIMSSGLATAIYLRDQKPSARVYLAGTPSLEEEFLSFGFQLVEENPDFAVLGFDTTLTYEKVHKLCDFILAGVPYIATHPDINCPTPDGFMPDIGAMMAMVEASTGKTADVVIGKPNPPMVSAVVSMTGFPAEQLTMVGDRLYTDIAMGEAGINTVLVLSGETRREDLDRAPHTPDLVCENLAELLGILQSEEMKGSE